MPKVNLYANKPGLYIRSAQGGRMATYQVTPEGQKLLKKSGLESGGEISVRDLNNLRDRGFVYTGGSGSEDLESQHFHPEPVSGSVVSPDRPNNQHSLDELSSLIVYTRYPRAEASKFAKQSRSSQHSVEVGKHSKSDDDSWWGMISFGAGSWICGLVSAASLQHLDYFGLLILIFVPFALASGFLAWWISLPFSRGYWWGQLFGPVGFLFVVFMLDNDRDSPHRVIDEKREDGTLNEINLEAGPLKLILWSSITFLLIIIIMCCLVIYFSGKPISVLFAGLQVEAVFKFAK